MFIERLKSGVSSNFWSNSGENGNLRWVPFDRPAPKISKCPFFRDSRELGHVTEQNADFVIFL